MRKAVVGSIFAVVASVLLVVVYMRAPISESARVGPIEATFGAPAKVEAEVAQIAAKPKATPVAGSSPPPSAKLAAEFKAATDWRAFALNARQRPEEGGYFYAIFVLNLCGMDAAAMPELASDAVAAAVAKTGTVTPAALKLTERFSTRCASFVSKEASSLNAEIKTSTSDKRDPLVNATQGLAAAAKGSDPKAIKDALQTLLSLNDPTAPYSSHLLERVMRKSSDAGRRGIWFDGYFYAEDDFIAIANMQIALHLAPCLGDVPCDLDTAMMISCLGGNSCADTPEQYLKQVYVEQGGMTEAQFSQGVALGGRLRQVVVNQEVRAFIR